MWKDLAGNDVAPIIRTVARYHYGRETMLMDPRPIIRQFRSSAKGTEVCSPASINQAMKRELSLTFHTYMPRQTSASEANHGFFG